MLRQEDGDEDDSNSFSSDDDIPYVTNNDLHPYHRKPLHRSLYPDVSKISKRDKKAKNEGNKREVHYNKTEESSRMIWSETGFNRNDTESQREESWWHSHGGPPAFISIGVALLFLLLLFALGQYFTHRQISNTSKEHKSAEMILKDIQQGIRHLREDFLQTKEFWVQVFSQIDQMIQENPVQPSVILAIVPSDSQKTAACLSQKILEIVSDAFDDRKHVAFDTHSHLSLDKDNFKHIMGESMERLNESHSAAVYNVESLPKEGIMLLHAFCDNVNAPFKRTLIWMTVELNFSYSSLDSLHIDQTVQSYLIERWSDRMREEDSAAILSRIANALVLIKPENSQSISKRCPI